MPSRYFDDPVAAYDHLAPQYATLSRRREAYLRAVERQVVGRISPGSCSLLDIGAGDGTRSRRIAEAAKLTRVVLAEPSAAMAAHMADNVEVWRARAEDLNAGSIHENFDVITCLWNSLGHVRGWTRRVRAFGTAARLLSAGGTFFVDVTHRYNAASYGWTASFARWMKDQLTPDDRNGDVTARWELESQSISTYGHVFTHREMVRLAAASGLQIEERVVIDYASGGVRPLAWCGNLLYVLHRNSRMESSSAPAMT